MRYDYTLDWMAVFLFPYHMAKCIQYEHLIIAHHSNSVYSRMYLCAEALQFPPNLFQYHNVPVH